MSASAEETCLPGERARWDESSLPWTAQLADADHHSVHFYEDDDGLAEVVAEFVSTGLRDGDPIVLVVTASHWRKIAERLRSYGFDLETARACEQLWVLDAQETLAQLMVGSMPDWERFSQHVGELLASLGEKCRPNRLLVYGEMVDLLWMQGNPGAAIRLEEMWNDLQRSSSFSLLCAYVMASFYKQDGDLQRVCNTHTHVVPRARGKADPNGAALRALTAEIAQRKEVEQTLKATLRQQQIVTDSLPVGVAYLDAGQVCQFANRAYERWFGDARASAFGAGLRPLPGTGVADGVAGHAALALAGETTSFRARARCADGLERFMDVTCIPHAGPQGRVLGFVALFCDVTETKLAEDASAAANDRTQRVLQITAAIADAVSREQVFEAVVERTAAAIEASHAGLWLLSADRREMHLVRSFGYSADELVAFESWPLDAVEQLPVVDAVRSGRPLWFASSAELLERYPHLAPRVSLGRDDRVTCLPIFGGGGALGVLTFTFAGASPIDRLGREFLELVARYSGQALERLQLVEDERRARVNGELLYGLAAAVIGAEDLTEVFGAALDGIERALGARRSSILAFDADGVLRFKAWRGLSDGYREAVSGHCPWPRDARAPEPLLVPDVFLDPAWAAYRELFAQENIRALGFIPLVAGGRLIGKFMVYYAEPHAFSAAELGLAQAIANHVATGIARFAAFEELQQTVRFNEMFAGVLGHDLRNPLASIVTGAHLALSRAEGEKLTKPLARVVSSASRMARMIDQLLDFTRVRVGSGILVDAKQLDLVPLLRQVLEELEGAHPGRRIEFVELGGDSCGVWDPDRLSQVFSNLAANALQHGHLEHPITLRIDGREAGCVCVELHNMGAIDAALLPVMFEPMVGGGARRERAQGLGLGLYISREIVKAHGGRIEVRSSPQAGTTFGVFLARSAASSTGVDARDGSADRR